MVGELAKARALSAGFDQCAWPEFDVPVLNLMRGPNLCDVPVLGWWSSVGAVLGWCSRPHNRKHCTIWITHKRHAIRAATSARPVKKSSRRARTRACRRGSNLQLESTESTREEACRCRRAHDKLLQAAESPRDHPRANVQTKIGVITASIKHRDGAVGDPEHLGVKTPRTRSVRHGQVKPSGESFVRYANDPK